MSFSFGSKKQSQKSKSQSDPWDVATPYIEDFLKTDVKPLIGTAGQGPTADQSAAFDQIKANANAGNPYAGSINDLTNDLFGSQSRAPQMDSAYADMTRRLAPTADGSNLNLENNQYLQSMLDKVAQDARTAANETFAGAGRSFSGAHAGALGSAVSDAQLPFLFQQYNLEQGRTDAAARDLFGGAGTAATTGQNLDQAAASLRAMGIDTGNAALEAKNWGPQQILAIEQTLRDMPVEQAAKLAAILFPAGQLGQQEEGKSSGKSSGFSLGANLLGGG